MDIRHVVKFKLVLGVITAQ